MKINRIFPTTTTIVGLSCALLLVRFDPSARADQIWAQFYDGPGHGDDLPYAVALDSLGNAIVTGSSRNQNGNDDFYTAKYAAVNGTLLWEVRYDGPYGGDDRATGVAVDGQDNVLVTGYSYDPTVIGGGPTCLGLVFYTAKYAAADGHLLWERRGPPAPCLQGLATEALEVKKVAVDRDGNVAITGVALHGSRCFYTAKYAALDGHTLWENFYTGPGLGGPDGDFPRGLAMDSGGNVIVTGSSGCCVSGQVHENIYTVKYAAADGSVIWDRRYDSGTGADDQAVDVTVDKEGNVLVLGANFSTQNFYYTAKYAAADGSILWDQHYPVPINSNCAGKDAFTSQRILADSAGNVIVGVDNGNQSPTGAVVNNNLVKYAAADGHVIWSRLFAESSCFSADPSRLALDSADNLIVRGAAAHSGFISAKYDLDGNVVWRQPFGVNIGDVAGGVAVDAGGNPVITVGYRNANGDFDYASVKYSASSTTTPPPAITCPANIVTGTDPGQCSAVVTYSPPTPADFCGNLLPVTCSPASGSVFPKGTTTVSCTASDGSSCGFTVTVNDTEKPVITCPANIVTSVPCGQSSAVVTFTATANDNCSSVSVACNPPSGSVFPAGVTTVNCTAQDASGNTASCSFTVTVNASIFAFTGLLPPIGGADGTGGSFASPLRTFKMNSTIPVKFTASCGGSPVLSGIHRLQVIQYTTQTTAGDPIDATPTDAATTGDQFRLTDSQWQFNLDTKATGMSAGIWLLRATLSDGSQHTAWIQIK